MVHFSTQDLTERLDKAPRRRGVIGLSQEQIIQRDFPDGSMGFQDLSCPEVRGNPGFSPFLASSLTAADFATDPGRAKKL